MMKPKQKKWKRWMLWAALASLGVFLFSPVVLYYIKNKAAYNRKIRELAEAGFPVSMPELKKRYVLPEGAENAADVYIQAFRLYIDPNQTEQEFLPVRGCYTPRGDVPPYPKEVMDAIRSSLEKNKDCLALLDKAGRIERCLFPRSFDILGFTRNYLSELKKTAQLLTERNLYLAQTGQTDELFDSTQTCIGLTNALSEQPFLINHLVSMSIKAIAAAGLENSLNLTGFSEEQLAILQQRVCWMRKIDTFPEALISECVYIPETLELPLGEQLQMLGYSVVGNFWDKPLFFFYSISGLKYQDALLIIEFREKESKAARLPLHEQLDVFNRIEKELISYSKLHWLLHVNATLFKVTKINLRVEGGLLCAETALAIERYRLKHKTLPASLEDLVPEFLDTVYLDPFDGKPIRYSLRDSGGYTVYIIGEDGIDQGGLDREQMAKIKGIRTTEEFDWPFTVKH